MDRSKNDTGLADFEGAIPAGLEHMTDEELRTDLWDTPTCQRCLPYFHPELAEPVCNRTESSATRTTRKRVILQGGPADLADGLSEGCWLCTRIFSEIQMHFSGSGPIEDFSQRFPNMQSAIRQKDGSSYLLEAHLDDDEDFQELFDLRRRD